MSDVQIAVIDQQDTQIVLAVPGVQGATGSSIPSGGTVDQVLRKNSSTNYDAGWTQVTSAMIANGTIINEDVNNSAAIAGTKISPDFGGQAITTTGQINGARINVTGNTVPSNGLYLPATNSVALSTNGTPRVQFGTSEVVFNDDGNNYDFRIEGDTVSNLFFVDASADKVGIGTSAPASTLDAAGDVSITGNENYLYLYSTYSVGSNSRVRIRAVGAGGGSGYGGDFRLSTRASNNTWNTDAFVVDNTGNVGIGPNGAGGYDVAFNPGTSSSPLIRDSSGRLLVGTSSTPAGAVALLQVQGYAGATTGVGLLELKRGAAVPANGEELGRIDFSSSASERGAVITAARDGGTWTTGSSYPGRLVFSTTADGESSPTERMRIASNGEIQFGNTTNGAYTVTRNHGVCAYFDRRTSDGVVVSFERQGTGVGNISVTTTATAYNTSSDYRLKENVVAVSDGITRLQQLKPSRFNFIADPTKTVDGFLAHEAAEVVPECVTGEKDAVDEDGSPIYQGIDQSKLVPLLTAALQEAVAKIESLEARLTAAGI